VRLGTRLFAIISLILAGTVITVIALADGILRGHFESEIADGLEREARLVMLLVPRDSAEWPDAARRLGALIGHRVTLIAPDGRVRGDADFDRASLGGLENHLQRPEVQAALREGTGRERRLSVSTNERQMYVAIRGSGPPGLAVVRVSTTLASVDAQIQAVQLAVALAGAAALIAAGLITWLAGGALARPLVRLGGAARAIAAGRPPEFPDSRIPEVAEHIHSLRTMHTELERRFQELTVEREESAMLIEAMADGVLAADPAGRVTAMNSAARLLLGYSSGATLPPLEQLFHEKRARDLVAEILKGEDVDQRELELGDRTLLATGRRLPDGGSLLVLRDVSQLRRLEAVRRDFVANVSHELKTPLTSIAGYAETLAQETPPGQPRQFADTIVHNARRMQRLVDDLLDLSRIESGGWRPQPEELELGRAIQDAWEAVVEAARHRGVTVAASPETAQQRVWADAEALHQVFINLFDNAIRHTPAGGRITVAAPKDGAAISIEVADTGSGIPAEHLPRIFERFYRVDPARSRDQGGTGLGLAIVKHLIEAHGGRVTAESALGQGTTIRFSLPTRPLA
jgi:two-component system phosphate regulon sensor histidine kinase PhoR